MICMRITETLVWIPLQTLGYVVRLLMMWRRDALLMNV